MGFFFFYFSPLPKSSLKLRMLFKSRADEWEGRRAAIRRELIGSWQRCQGPSLDNLSERERTERRAKKKERKYRVIGKSFLSLLVINASSKLLRSR